MTASAKGALTALALYVAGLATLARISHLADKIATYPALSVRDSLSLTLYLAGLGWTGICFVVGAAVQTFLTPKER